MKPETQELLDRYRRTRKFRANFPKRARIVAYATLLNFLLFFVGFMLVCASGMRVDPRLKNEPYIIVNKGSYYRVSPSAYLYFRVHDALTVLLFIPGMAAALYLSVQEFAKKANQ